MSDWAPVYLVIEWVKDRVFHYYPKYILKITKHSQYRYTQLQYRFAVTSEAPSNIRAMVTFTVCNSKELYIRTIRIFPNINFIHFNSQFVPALLRWIYLYFSWFMARYLYQMITRCARGKRKQDGKWFQIATAFNQGLFITPRFRSKQMSSTNQINNFTLDACVPISELPYIVNILCYTQLKSKKINMVSCLSKSLFSL